jgi:hypothetical protein
MTKKSKHAGLAEQNGFDPAFLEVVKATAKRNTYQTRV